MGYAGFSSGEVYGEHVKADDKYVLDSRWLDVNQVETTDANISAGNAADTGTLSGVSVMKFDASSDEGVNFATKVPDSVSEDARCRIRGYFTEDTVSSDTIVWDVDYRSITVSGVNASGGASGVNYNVTAGRTNVTTSVSGVAASSGEDQALSKFDLDIPSTAIKNGDILVAEVYRDADETADTASSEACVLGFELRFEEV